MEKHNPTLASEGKGNLSLTGSKKIKEELIEGVSQERLHSSQFYSALDEDSQKAFPTEQIVDLTLQESDGNEDPSEEAQKKGKTSDIMDLDSETVGLALTNLETELIPMDLGQEKTKRGRSPSNSGLDKETAASQQTQNNKVPYKNPNESEKSTLPSQKTSVTEQDANKKGTSDANDTSGPSKPKSSLAKAVNTYPSKKESSLNPSTKKDVPASEEIEKVLPKEVNSTPSLPSQDKYSVEVRARAAKYLAKQEATSSGHKKQEIYSVLMCVMLHKQKNILDITQNRNHVQQLRELLHMMKKADDSTALIPVDNDVDDQTPLTTIPQEISTIWKRELQPYISAKNCEFGNRYTQSLRIRISTAQYVDPYSMGKWITDNWASRRNANVFHDRIQEGVKVQAACFTNVADTMNYRDLQGDLERQVNNELMNLCQQSGDNSENRSRTSLQKIKINVYPGILEQVKNSQLYQAHVAWIYAGKSKLNILMDILNSMNDNLEDEEDESSILTESSRTLGRNIVLTVAPHHATSDHLSKLIEYQNEYFVSLDYRYVAYLPSPDTVLETKEGKTTTLRSILLNMTNLAPTPGTYNIFSQVDRGMTIKTGKRSGRPPSKGVTFTFQQSALEEAMKAISTLPQFLENLIAPSHHHLLLPEDQAIPPELINFSSEKTSHVPKFNQNAEKQLRRMTKLKGATHSTALVPQSSNFSFAPTIKSPPSIKELRAIARKTIKASETDSAKTPSSNTTTYAGAVSQSTSFFPPLGSSIASSVPPSSPSVSSITNSQLSNNHFASTPTSGGEIVIFQKETEKKLAEHNKATIDTLSLFKQELEKASTSASQFQNLVLTSQQQNNSRLATLETSMSQIINSNQRIEQLLHEGIASPSSSSPSSQNNSSALGNQGNNP